jgi:DNA repair protein SbcD/Mre11
MNRLRILHLADLHLGWTPEFMGEKKEERAKERDSLLQKAVDFALNKQNHIQAVVVAGDLFESHRPTAKLVEEVRNQLRRLDTGGVFLLTVPGNHDEITYSDSVYRQESKRWPGVLTDSPSLSETAKITMDGKTIAFYSVAYTGGITVTNPPLSQFPKSDAHLHIGVIHGSIDWDTGDRSLPISSAALASSGYHCVALGHIHKHSVRNFGATTAVYAGACEAKTFDDPGCGHFTVITLGERTSVATVPAGTRPCLTRKLDLNLFESTSEIADAIKNEANPKALVRILLTGQANFRVNSEQLHAQCSDYFYHLAVDSDGVFIDEQLLASLGAEPNIRGYFVKKLLDRLDKADDEEEKRIIKKALLRGVSALQAGETQ